MSITVIVILMSTLEDLTAASDAIRNLDTRRREQQTYRDALIRKAKDEGIGWAAIRRATGMLDRSLHLALQRTAPTE